jgi:hypothetical protein
LCELHVWPGNELRSSFNGFYRNGIPDAALTGRKGYKQLPPNSLPTTRQLEGLRSLPLAQLIGLNGYSVVLHDQPLDSRTLRTTPRRLFPQSASCYAELAIDNVFYQEAFADGRSLKVLFHFKKFAGDNASRSFGTYISEKLIRYGPHDTSVDPQPGLNELFTAFSTAISEFGLVLNKPDKPKHEKHQNRRGN